MTVLPEDVAEGTRLLDAAGMSRTVARLAHEVRERHPSLERVVVAGIRTGGVPLACALAAVLGGIAGVEVALAELDVSDYRDDRPRRTDVERGAIGGLRPDGAVTEAPDIDGATVVVVDDVIHTGRTLRAALDLLTAHGRPAAVELLVLIDRGHRELPLRATYVGRNLPVADGQWVHVVLDGASAGAWAVPR